MYYMKNVTCCELISSWQQCIVVSPYTAPVFSAVLPHWHDVRKKTSKMCTPPGNINSRVARSKSTDVAAMVMEERQVKYWELTDSSLWVVEQLCETFLHSCTVRYHSAVWNLGVELTLYFNLYELTAWFQCCMLGKNWMNGHNGNCLRFWYGKCIKRVKSLFCCELCTILKRGIFLHVVVLKGQHVGYINHMGEFWCFFILTSVKKTS